MEEAELEKKEEQKRTVLAKKSFLKAFEQSLGVIKIACDAAKVSRRAYYNWVRDDSVFAAQCEEVEDIQGGYVNDKFIELIAAGHAGAIMFYLAKRNIKYKEKLELSGEVTTRAKYADYTDDDLIKILADAKKFKQEQENGNVNREQT